MATSKYNPITNNTYHYNDRGEVTRIDTGRNTSSRSTINGTYTDRATSTTGRTYDVGRVEKLNTDSGGNPVWTTRTGNQIAVRPGSDVITDDDNYFLGTRKQSGAASYIGDTGSETNFTTNALNDLYAAQLQSRIEALDKVKASALSGLDAEKTSLGSQYYNKKNQAGARSDIGALNFAQFMASKGVQGNASAMPEIYRNASLQEQIGALDQQEALGYADIEARRTDINAAYEKDLAAAKADIEAQQLAAQIEQQRLDQANALEQQKLAATANTVADNTAYTRLQDEKAAYADNVGQYSANYQAHIDEILSDGDPSNDWQAEIDRAARMKKIDDANKKYQQQGYVSEDIAAALNLPVGTMSEAYKTKQNEAQIDNAFKIFQQTGIASAEVARILSAYGITPGMTTTQYYNAHKPKATGGSLSGNDYALKW